MEPYQRNNKSIQDRISSRYQTRESLYSLNVSGTMKQYEIQINKIVPSDKDVLKSMEIEVTDKELLKLTNGIIQE